MESLAPRKESWIRAEREGKDTLPVAKAGDLGHLSFATSEPASDLKEEVKGCLWEIRWGGRFRTQWRLVGFLSVISFWRILIWKELIVASFPFFVWSSFSSMLHLL
ncbi:hypothetical protein BHM03_00046948 [Ensete ventricosum]|nr:hypothetical protein BHM03_00046948 [Ensete ventricosum]